MSELDIRRDDDTALAETIADPTGGRLVAWAHAMHAAHQLGQALSQTTFVPSHFRGKPDEAAAAIMYGDELGLTPGQALQSIYVVSGKPGLFARSMVALVLNAGHELWTEASSPQRVTVCGRRRGTSHVEQVEWTQSKAQQAGYTSNPQYKTNPEAMLYARASSDVARRIAPDALAGLAFSVEELQLDSSDGSEATTTVRPARARTAQRQPLPAPPEPEEPSLDDEAAEQPTEQSAEQPSDHDTTVADDPVTDPQLRKIMASFRDLGVEDRTQRLTISRAAVGRDLASANELTKTEAGVLLDRLDEIAALDDEDKPLVLTEMSEQDDESTA